MEELKIWTVTAKGSPGVSELATTREMETENLLEHILTKNPDMLENGLDLVGRQFDTTGGALDLLGVGNDGKLVVFELKRGRLNREAVAQVIDYASGLATMDLDSLHRLIAERSGNLGIQKIDDFAEWYNKNYPDYDPDSLMPPRIVLVGLGVDNTTERMVNYLKDGGLDVSLLTFHGFKHGSDTLLARHVEVDNSPEPTTQTSKLGPKQKFIGIAQSSGVQPLVEAVTEMFMSRREPRFGIHYAIVRKQFNLSFAWHQGDWAPKSAATLFIELAQGAVNIGFHPVAVALATQDAFDKLKDEDIEFERSGAQVFFRIDSTDYELKHQLRSLEEWKAREEQLAALVQKVCVGYDALKKKTLEEKAAGGE